MYAQVGERDYWSEVVPPARWVTMALKYDALSALASMDDDAPARPSALRSAARAWPGALREAELAGPQVCARRRARARAAVCEPARTRAGWSDDELAQAVVLWADLHRLLADQLAFRRRGGTKTHEFVASLEGSARARWPAADVLIERGGVRLRPRQAYLWLASRSGLSLSALNHRLFARAGHWDRRDDDPEWARIG